MRIFLFVLFMYPWASVPFALGENPEFQTGQRLWNTTAQPCIPLTQPARQGADPPAMIPASVGNSMVQTSPHGMASLPYGSSSFSTLLSHLIYTGITSTRL